MRVDDMKCREVHSKIDELFDTGRECLFLDETAARHVEICDLCKQYYLDGYLKQEILALRVPEPRAGFVDSSITKAIRANTGQKRNYWQFASMAAVLMLGIFLGTVFSRHYYLDSQVVDTAQWIEIFDGQVKPVNLIIDSDQHVGRATIHLLLADNMELNGYPDTRELQWETELLPGKNLLTLPISLKDGKDSYFEVSYSMGDDVQRTRFNVRSRSGEQKPMTRSI